MCLSPSYPPLPTSLSAAPVSEEAERRAATEREEASRRRQHEALASLLNRNLRLTPAALTWEEARSRARRLYPGKKIVDRFRDLPNDRVVTPAAEKIVAVVRIQGVYPHFFRPGRCLEVRGERERGRERERDVMSNQLAK